MLRTAEKFGVLAVVKRMKNLEVIDLETKENSKENRLSFEMVPAILIYMHIR